MKLLICTQKVDINDDVLGFMHGWIREFSKHCEKLTVICLYKGEYDLPDNVKVLSLGKETSNKKPEIGNSRLVNRIFYTVNFYKYIWQERKNYDYVFVHMNSEYMVLGGIFWKFFTKKLYLWYVHKAINWKLRIAEKLADNIFTASPEGCGITSNKVKVLGHGINLKQFSSKRFKAKDSDNKFKIVYVGRISKIKNQELLIRAIDILVNKDNIKNIEVSLAGGSIYPSDQEYFKFLKALVKDFGLENLVTFMGSIPNKDIVNIFQANDLSINLCPTGGMDKAVLESWASGTPCLVFNKTFSPSLKKFSELILEEDDVDEFADKIKAIIKMDESRKKLIVDFLRNEVSSKHSLEKLVARIINLIS